MKTVWMFLLLLWPSLVKGISLSPCGSDNVQEVVNEQENHFICKAEKPVYWTLQSKDTTTGKLVLAVCDENCTQLETLGKLFIVRTIDAGRSSMIIKPVNNTMLYNYVQLLNGSLECSLRDERKSARCGLNYVDPPKNVTCTAANVSWSVNVSCVISSVYSSRKSYSCQLLYRKDKNKTLENVSMVTSPTWERISKSEVKVSGSCQFNTTLPTEEGLYGFLVLISPSGQHFAASDKWFTVEQPKSPTVSCSPYPYVLENTNVICTCRTTSLGQPAGYLRWIIANLTNEKIAVVQEEHTFVSKELQYTHHMTLSDHDRTWLRCDVIWGTSGSQGENYTARVGYGSKTPRLSLNGRGRHVTVMEGDKVQFRCESDGRPAPNVSIYNNDNNSVIVRGSSLVVYTVIARCQDTATYSCAAKNEFSRHVTSSYNIKLGVGCKPQSVSTTGIQKFQFRNKTEEKNFDVMAYPVPHKYRIWYVEPVITNTSEPLQENVKDSEMTVTCSASAERSYLSKCTLTIFSIIYPSGFYKVQIINEHGDENFTFEISYGE
ncbi:uncharacterized protein LOC112569634 [Pomacea canaliculata]|uniref:uncharacterized protein LOC112569634 n=1 Tax=Pomacea canaliculata TaxID=400727 RepID=UPI000D72D3C5|nr:uncharacterized protein LOC112569634 [Pomacea canaliculata]